jgi:NAD(P)-dependent dehydrogenase (short-subunit alcohol dehydrogenase family)
VASDASVTAAVGQVVERFGRIDSWSTTPASARWVPPRKVRRAGQSGLRHQRQPFMAVYGASKHAIEGYSQSLDHEVRQYGIRALLVEPAYTRTGFEANSSRLDMPLAVYAEQRHTFGRVMAAAIKNGDDPAIVARVIVTAATDAKPKLRYTAGAVAGRADTLRRVVPARAFDRQIRKLNHLAG